MRSEVFQNGLPMKSACFTPSSMRRLITASVLVLAASLLPVWDANAAPTAPCYAQFHGQTLFLINGTLVSCARTIKAAGGYGSWGGHSVHVDSNSHTYVDGRLIGVAPSRSGSPSSGYYGPNGGANLERRNAEYYNSKQLPIGGGSYTGGR
jgi:hypothetical protein